MQRYRCNDCKRLFNALNSPDLAQIWADYALGKQTYAQLAERYCCSVRTIQRHLQKSPKMPFNDNLPKRVNIVMDTTFFGRQFAVMVLMDSITKRVISYAILRSEKNEHYFNAISMLQRKGIIIQSITCDGRRGLLQKYPSIPTQMCHFHQIARMRFYLTHRPKNEAAKQLKALVKTLKFSDKKTFENGLANWLATYQNYLDERSETSEKGRKRFKHPRLRSAYLSLKRNLPYLFAFETKAEFEIEKTTNRLEGLFSELKRHLSAHNGLSKENKCMFIKDFMNRKSWFSG